jgi:Phage portal protein.
MQGQKVPVSTGLIARVSGAFKSLFGVNQTAAGNQAETFFGPGERIEPVISNKEGAGVIGRQFDYPVAYNKVYRPRSTELNTFEQLRGLADNCDVLRAAIETRKDAVDAFRFEVKPRDGKNQNRKCKQIQDFLRFPNGEHDFATWARAVIEDMLVIDAVTIYPWKTYGGDVFRLELMDGSTIKRLIDPTGRTPMIGPAYQQVIKGVPVADYEFNELVYHPRNIRTNKIYGNSVVEQIVMTVNTAIRRSLHQLQFYTEGSTPDLIISLPDGYDMEQVKQFEQYWNDLLAGDTAERRKTKFVPNGSKPINTKEGALQDAFDEWLSRVICYAMNVPNQWAIKQQTRAGQDVEQSSADKRGDEITKSYLKSLLDRIIAQHFNSPELEIAWTTEEEIDPVGRADIFDKKIRNGSMSINEAREADNLPRIDGGDIPMFATATGFVPIKLAAEGGDGANNQPESKQDKSQEPQ